jgi:hypothetical protein
MGETAGNTLYYFLRTSVSNNYVNIRNRTNLRYDCAFLFDVFLQLFTNVRLVILYISTQSFLWFSFSCSSPVPSPRVSVCM